MSEINEMTDELATPEVIERRRQWVAALESGDYEQGQLRLRRGNNFCCLGVACDLYNDKQWHDTGENQLYGETLLDAKTWSPPDDVVEFFGLDDDIIPTLAERNDNGVTFKQIAAFIKSRIQYKNM